MGADAVVRVKGSILKGGISLAANFLNSSTAKGSATVLLTQGTLATTSVQRGQLDDAAPGNGYGSVSFTMGGGTLRPYDADAAFGNATAARNFDITLTGTGSTISGRDDFGAVPRTVDLYANLSGSGGVTFSGGTVNIRGTNTHAGLTTVAAGGTAALLGTAASSSGFAVNGTLDLASQTSGFTFGSAQTVSGTGVIALPTSGPGVSLAGFLAPGNSPGTLSFSGAGLLDLTAAIDTESGRLLFELGAVGVSDAVTVADGTLAIGTGLLEFSDFAFTALGGFDQGTYTLFTANAITGTLGSGTTGTIGSYTGTLQQAGNTIQLVVVPEPHALALAALGIAAATLTFRRLRV